MVARSMQMAGMRSSPPSKKGGHSPKAEFSNLLRGRHSAQYNAEARGWNKLSPELAIVGMLTDPELTKLTVTYTSHWTGNL